MVKKIDVRKHVLVPPHSKLNEKEKKDILERYNISSKQMPKILKNDPAIAHINVKVGDIIKIERNSVTAGKTMFFREVSNV